MKLFIVIVIGPLTAHVIINRLVDCTCSSRCAIKISYDFCITPIPELYGPMAVSQLLTIKLQLIYITIVNASNYLSNKKNNDAIWWKAPDVENTTFSYDYTYMDLLRSCYRIFIKIEQQTKQKPCNWQDNSKFVFIYTEYDINKIPLML